MQSRTLARGGQAHKTEKDANNPFQSESGDKSRAAGCTRHSPRSLRLSRHSLTGTDTHARSLFTLTRQTGRRDALNFKYIPCARVPSMCTRRATLTPSFYNSTKFPDTAICFSRFALNYQLRCLCRVGHNF